MAATTPRPNDAEQSGGAPDDAQGAAVEPNAEEEGHVPVRGPAAQPVDLARPAQLKVIGEPVADLSFSPDGQQISVISNRGEVCLCDLTTRECRILNEPQHYDFAKDDSPFVAFTADGRFLVSGNQFRVEVWNVTTGRREHWFGIVPEGVTEGTRLNGFVASNDGSRVVTLEYPGNGTSRYHVWDTATGQEILAFVWADGGSPVLTFSPDGKLLAVNVGDAEQTRLIDVANGKELPSLKFGYDVLTLLAAPYRLLGRKNREFYEWEINSDGTYQIKARGELPRDVEAPYGRTIPTVDGSGALFSDGRLWNVEQRAVQTRPLRGARSSFVISPDGSSLLALKQDGDHPERLDVIEADPLTGEVRKEHQLALQDDPLQLGPDAFTFDEPLAASPDGRVLAVGTYAGDVLL